MRLLFMSRVVTVLATLMALAVLAPAGSEAGLLDCLWGGGAGGQAQTTYTPRYVTPAVYYPSSSAAPAGPFARLRAALRPTPVSAGTTCYCVPQVCYRQVVQPTAVTSHLPVVARDACTGCPVTVYQPVVTWSNQVRLVPYTTYRMVCTQAQYVPAVCATAIYSGYQQPSAYSSAPAAVGSCTTCVPNTSYMPLISNGPTAAYMPVITGGVGSASGSYPAAYPGPTTVQPGGVTVPGSGSSTGVPSSSGATTGSGGAATNSSSGWFGGGSGSGAGAGKGGDAAPGTQAPSGGLPPGTPSSKSSGPSGGTSGGAASGSTWGITPGGTLGGGTPGSTSAGPSGGRSSSGTTGGGTSYGLPSNSGTGWPSRWGGIPLPSQIQQPSGKPTQQLPPRSAPAGNTQPQPAPAGPALTDPGDKTALLPPLVARSTEPVRGRLVPVERLQIPEHNNNHTVEERPANGAWSIVRN